MQLSHLVNEVRQITGTFVRNDTLGNVPSNKYSDAFRRAFYISQFNVVKLEALLFHPSLMAIKAFIPEFSFPFRDLPSQKLEGLREVVLEFQKFAAAFEFFEDQYHDDFWMPILKKLFSFPLKMESQFRFENVHEDYPNLLVDFAVFLLKSGKNSKCPLLLAELSRRDFTQDDHKDEEKLAFMMASSMLKLLGLFRHSDRSTLEKLRIIGLLLGGTSFQVCRLYTVFPSSDPENLSDYYFVFETSKDYLRYKILENYKVDVRLKISGGSEEIRQSQSEISTNIQITAQDTASNVPIDFELSFVDIESGSSEIHTRSNSEDSPPFTSELPQRRRKNPAESESEEERNLILGQSVPPPLRRGAETSEPATRVSKSKLKPEILSAALEAEYEAKYGVINDEALKVLERITELVDEQKRLIESLNSDCDFDPSFRYDESRIKLMRPGRPEIYYNRSPDQMIKSAPALNEFFTPSKVNEIGTLITPDFESVSSLINSITESDIEYDSENIEPSNSNNPLEHGKVISRESTVVDSSSTFSSSSLILIKPKSNVEVAIFNNDIVRNSCYFPRLKSLKELEKDKIIYEIEDILSLKSIKKMENSTENVELFICKLLIDCFSSIRTLHGAGFVHGKIWSSSIGRGATVWQLYNFQDSKPITEINEHMKYEDYYYLTLACICSVSEIVDVKGIWEPFKFVLEPIIMAKQPLNQLQLDKIYFNIFILYWNLNNHNSGDVSIRSGLPLLKQLLP